MSLETMIGSLTRDEKLAAMDLIWQDISTDATSLVSPEWHAMIIAGRLENPLPGRALPLGEAKAEIRKALDARRTQG